MDPILKKLRQRLDRWELEHLRQHARLLADQVDELTEQLADMRARLDDAEDRAEFWRGALRDVEDQLAEDLRLAMTRSGGLIVIEDRDVVDFDEHRVEKPTSRPTTKQSRPTTKQAAAKPVVKAAKPVVKSTPGARQ